jgi:radical SAM protein with 4Fe4S-binding SPASM domain
MSTQFDPLALAKTSKTFCIFPWIHQYVGPPGDVKPCCVYKYTDEIGSLKENTLEEIWNNDRTKQMRLNFLNGVQDPSCAICNNREADFGSAYKNEYNIKFFDKDETIQQIVASTNIDGSLPEHKLFYIDVRYNNLCNLSCRSCAPHYSTSWILDHRKLYDLVIRRDKDDGFQYPGKTEDQALEETLPQLVNAKCIYFAGGEPLMQKEHYEVLNKLIELENFDVEIRYNTNFNNFKLKKYDNVIDYWKKFKNVNVYASLDGSYEKAEYWRNGTIWNDVVANRKRMLEETPHVNFRIAFTLSWPNAFNLIEFHREWVELGYISPGDIMINPLDTPPYYCLKNIPDWKKREIEDKLNENIEWLKSFGKINEFNYLHEHVITQYDTAIKFMWSNTDSYSSGLNESLKMFSHITTKLDKIRNQSFFDVYPEHNNIKNYLIHNQLNIEISKNELSGFNK